MKLKKTYRIPIFVREIHGRGTALDPGAIDKYVNFAVHDVKRTIEKRTDLIEIFKVTFYSRMLLRVSFGFGGFSSAAEGGSRLDRQ